MSEDVTEQQAGEEAEPQKASNPYSMLLAILGGGVALALVIFAIGLVADNGDAGRWRRGHTR